jgi:hypothetical protein
LPVTLGARVRRSAYKRGSIPQAVAMPSYSSLVLLPSTFRAPKWGTAGWLSSCCRLRSATSWELAFFSHRSASRIFIVQPGCIPSPMVIRRDDHQHGGGEKQAGLWPLPRPQLQGCSSSGLRRRARRVGATSAWAGDPFLPPTLGGEGHPPALRRRPPAMRGKANCCYLARVQLSVLHPGDGRAVRGPATSRSSSRRRLHRGVAQYVVRREGGTRVLGRPRRGQEGGPAGALWGDRHSPARCWWAGGRCHRC